MTETPTQLDYGLAPPTGQRKLIRFMTIALIVLGVLVAGWLTAPRVRGTIEARRLYRQAMSFTRPAVMVVVEPDGVRGAALVRSNTDYQPGDGGTVNHGMRSPSGGLVASVFLHARSRPDGTVRLIRVADEPLLGGPGLICWAMKPPTVFNPAPNARSTIIPFPAGPPGEHPRLYAGQPDPNDASRFTIKCEYSDHSAIIRGTLCDDDTVSFDYVADASPTTQESP